MALETTLQTVRIARVPVIGRYKKAWDPAKAEAIFKAIPDTPEGRQEYMDKFKARGLSGKTNLTESMVYMRLAHPVESREYWEILTDTDLIVARKRLHLNPVRILSILMKEIINPKNPKLTANEQIYLNKVVLKKRMLFLNKVGYPRHVTNVEAHLASLAQLAINIKTRQGNPIKAVVKFFNTYQDVQFQKDIAGTLLDNSYGMPKDEFESLPLAPFKAAVDEFLMESEQKPREEKQYSLDFLNGISNPEEYFRYFPKVTTLDMVSYKYEGVLGLQEALRSERGNLAAINQFRKIVTAAMIFNALMTLAALSVLGPMFVITPPNGAGQGSQISSVADPTLTPPPTAEDDADTDEDMIKQGSYNALATPGLFDEDVNPGHPEWNRTPCDPQHNISDKRQALRKTGKYKDDIELSKANPNLELEALAQVLALATNPQTGCLEHFIKVFEAK